MKVLSEAAEKTWVWKYYKTSVCEREKLRARKKKVESCLKPISDKIMQRLRYKMVIKRIEL